MSRGSVIVILLLTGSALLPGSEQAQTPPNPGTLRQRAPYVLGPDDQVKVWALGVEEISDKPVRISPSGDLDLPVVGQVHAAGLTVEQLKAELVQRLARDVRTPQVSVEIVDFGSQPVSIMGAVGQPGVHQLRGRRTLAEIVSMAGGLKPEAGPSIHISRPIQFGPVPLPGAAADSSGKFSTAQVSVKELLSGAYPAVNIPILPHDVITVPLAEPVFVMGTVVKPGEVILKDEPTISVLQALASAGGFGPTPAPRNARIVRFVPGTALRQEIQVDLIKVQTGEAEDIAMRPRDILVVPSSGSKKAAARAVEAAIQTVTGIAIWGRHL